MKPSLLNINGTDYPFANHDNYRAYLTDMSESSRMINGRMTTEVRGSYWVIEYT